MSQAASVALFVESLLLAQKPPMAQPDGRPLYGYRVEGDRYPILLERVRNEFAALCRGRASVEAAAGFALYAAETWRRSDDLARWNSWAVVLDGLGVEDLPITALYPVVRRGLDYWHRPLRALGGRNRYVATLVCEGGLPLHLVRSEGSRFRRYFRRLLGHARDFGRDIERLVQAAEAEANDLPSSLRLAQVYGLAADLVAEIWRAHERLVGATADPIATLDHLDPTWRDRLPLRLDDAVAQELLKGLLRDVVEVAAERRAVPRVKRWLEEHDDGWRLRACLETPGEASTTKFAELLPEGAGEVPKHARLALATVTHTLPPFGTLYRYGDDRLTVERVAPRRAEVDDDDAAGRLALVIDAAATRAAETITVAVPGGQELSATQPWVFRAKDATTGHAKLLADGSCRAKQAEALVALPEGVRVEVAPGGEWRQLGVLRGLGRVLFECRGEVRIADDDGDTWRVATSQPADDELEFFLQGGRCTAGSSAKFEVFLGPPRVLARSVAGDAAAMPNYEMVWRSAIRGATWRQDGSAARGTIDLRVRIDGATCLSRRVCIVPKQFGCRIVPESATRGRIEFTGLEGGEVRVQTAPGTTVETAPNQSLDQTVLVCDARGEAPTQLRVQLAWPVAQPIEFTIPAPFRSAHFVADDGSKLTNAPAAFHDLYQLRVQVVTAERGVRYDVVGELRNSRSGVGAANRKIAVDFPLREVEPGRHEADLRRLVEPLRRALRTVPDLDTHLLLRLERNDSQQAQPQLEVHRYAATLSFAKEEGWVEVASSSPLLGLAAQTMSIRAFPLWLPQQRDCELDVAPTPKPSWLFDPQKRVPGPWLLYGTQDGIACTRPSLWTIAGETPASKTNAHQRAVLAPPECQAAARSELYDALLAGTDDDAWADLYALIARTVTLPASSFKTVLDLPEHPAVLVACLAAANTTLHETVFALRDELPFEWSFLPLSAWHIGYAAWATRRRRQFVAAQLPDQDVTELLAQDALRILARLPATERALRLVLQTVCHRVAPGVGMPKEVKMAEHPATWASFAINVQLLWQATLRRLAGTARWPVMQDVNTWARSQPEIAMCLPCFVEGDDPPHHRSIARAPWVAACAAAADVKLEPMLAMQLLHARAFDPGWFDGAHEVYLAIALAKSPSTQGKDP